jgi:hypothetical protein
MFLQALRNKIRNGAREHERASKTMERHRAVMIGWLVSYGKTAKRELLIFPIRETNSQLHYMVLRAGNQYPISVLHESLKDTRKQGCGPFGARTPVFGLLPFVS